MATVKEVKDLARAGAVEIRFARRNVKPGQKPTRRMLMSLNRDILESNEGSTVLNFQPPRNGARYDAESYALATVWDIIKQGWRNVSTESVEVIQSIPADQFWDWFAKNIAPMSPDEKKDYENQ